MYSNQNPINEGEQIKKELKEIGDKYKHTKEKNLTKKLIWIFGLIIAVCLGVLIVLGTMYFVLKMTNTEKIDQNFSSESSQSKNVSKININFPSFYDPKDPGGSFVNNPNQTNSAESKTTVANSSTSQLPSYNIDLQLVDSNYQKQTILSSQCNSRISTLNGLIRFIPADKNTSDSSLTIAHKRLATKPFEALQWQIAKNFLNRETDFMSDGDTGYGPDYLQILRVGCDSSNITRVMELELTRELKFDKARAWVTLNSPNNFPEITVNIYAELGDHIMVFTKNTKFDDFFRQEQFLACSDNGGIPKRDCLSNTIKSTDFLKQKLNNDVIDLLQKYELKENKVK